MNEHRYTSLVMNVLMKLYNTAMNTATVCSFPQKNISKYFYSLSLKNNGLFMKLGTRSNNLIMYGLLIILLLLSFTKSY